MYDDPIAELTSRVLARVRQGSLDTADQIMRVPGAEFTGRERFQADREMLRQYPQVVGWSDEVRSPGDYFTKNIGGTPVLAVRDKDGGLRAFINACRHRGAAVAEGCGNARKFVCPYHAWTYELDGRLTGVPERGMFAGMDLASSGLIPLPVGERAGIIVAGLHGDCDVAGYLDQIGEMLPTDRFIRRRYYSTRSFDIKANWKLAIGLNFEGYHFPFLHKQSVALMATNNSVFDLFGEHCRWAFPFIDFDNAVQASGAMRSDEFHGIVVYFMFPSTVLIDTSGGTQMLRTYPGDQPGESIVHMDYLTQRPLVTEADREECEQSLDTSCSILIGEDFPQVESCQRGLEAGLPHVVFGRNEPTLHHLNRGWNRASDSFRQRV